MTDATQRLLQRLELMEFLDAYIAILDDDRLEEWPGMFVEDWLYEIIPKENEDQGRPHGDRDWHVAGCIVCRRMRACGRG